MWGYIYCPEAQFLTTCILHLLFLQVKFNTNSRNEINCQEREFCKQVINIDQNVISFPGVSIFSSPLCKKRNSASFKPLPLYHTKKFAEPSKMIRGVLRRAGNDVDVLRSQILLAVQCPVQGLASKASYTMSGCQVWVFISSCNETRMPETTLVLPTEGRKILCISGNCCGQMGAGVGLAESNFESAIRIVLCFTEDIENPGFIELYGRH